MTKYIVKPKMVSSLEEGGIIMIDWANWILDYFIRARNKPTVSKLMRGSKEINRMREEIKAKSEDFLARLSKLGRSL